MKVTIFERAAAACVAAVAMIFVAAPSSAHAGKTLDAIKSRGVLMCGVNTGLAGFAAADASGRWAGLDVDICRALAAAVLGDGGKVRYLPLDAGQRFTALQSGEVDVLSRNTTFSLTRDASMGLHQTAVTFYDGQGFIVPAKSKIRNARQLKGQSVCVQSGTTTEKNLVDYSRANALDIKSVAFAKVDAATAAYFAGRCVAYTTDASALASVRSQTPNAAAAHRILPERISKSAFGPVVRSSDVQWLKIVQWTLFALINAEGSISSASMASMLR